MSKFGSLTYFAQTNTHLSFQLSDCGVVLILELSIQWHYAGRKGKVKHVGNATVVL